MAKVSNEKKLEAVKDWLRENNIKYLEAHDLNKSLKADMWIPSLMIAVHVGEDDGFYKKTYRWCKPFFIRDNETLKFVIEKIQNCCYDQIIKMQRKFEKNKKGA